MRLQSTHPPAMTSVIQPYLGVPTQIDLVVARSRLPTPTVNHDQIWSNAINVVVDSCSIQLLIRSSVHCFLHTGHWLQSFHSNGAPAEAKRPGRDGCLHRRGALMWGLGMVGSLVELQSVLALELLWVGIPLKLIGLANLRRRGRIIGSCGHRSIL